MTRLVDILEKYYCRGISIMDCIKFLIPILLSVYIFSQFHSVVMFRRAISFEEYRNDWGIVSGASKGIGKAYAYSLAKHGLNVCLIARSEDKLKEIARNLEDIYHVKTKVIVADYNEENTYDLIKNEIENHLDGEIGILINNVGGVQFDRPVRRYLDFSLEEEQKIWNLNLRATMWMTRIVLPLMLDQHKNQGKRKKKGRILNVSSLASKFPQFLIPYATCKTRINAITESLAIEYPEVEFQSHLVGEVATERLFTEPKFGVPSPEVMAESSLDKFGLGGVEIVPFWQHQLQWFGMSLLPKFLRNYILNDIIYPRLMDQLEPSK